MKQLALWAPILWGILFAPVVADTLLGWYGPPPWRAWQISLLLACTFGPIAVFALAPGWWRRREHSSTNSISEKP